MISKKDWSRAVNFARGGTLFADSEMHGEDHWRAVASQGILAAEICDLSTQDRAAGALFGLFHDCRRENDGYDPQHGYRAALAFLQWAETVSLPALFMKNMTESLTLHDDGQVTKNSTIGLGWDADRSTLGRVGIIPEFQFFSCIPEVHFDTYIATGEAVTETPPNWDDIYIRAFG